MAEAKTPTIEDVQLYLNRTENAALLPDGEKGPATTAAVVAWQTKHGIDPATGNLDPVTLGKMFPAMDNATSKPLTIQATVQDWVLNFVESKINQVAVAAVAIAIGWITTKFGINVSPELQQWVTSGLIALGGAVIVFLRGMGKDTPRVASKTPAVIQKPDEYIGQKN
jgi:peptidoglycan hydrolase-like protein with peptidoglycan-binding domain